MTSTGGHVSKRTRENVEDEDFAARSQPNEIVEDDNFEDPFGDEYEKESSIYDTEEDEDEEEEGKSNQQSRPWIPGLDKLEDDEELEFDPSAYDMYHRAELEWSCFSFDIFNDHLGQCRTEYPHTAYVIAGTQSEEESSNGLFIMKWRNITRSRKRADSIESESSTDSLSNDEPILDFKRIRHSASFNRIRICPQLPRLVGTWCADNKVYMWDIKEQFERLDTPGPAPSQNQDPKFVYSGHKDEGFALSFNPLRTGQLATGSRDCSLRLWMPRESGWDVEEIESSHTASIEDVQWRSTGPNDLLASCSIDQSIRIFDFKNWKAKPAMRIEHAHPADVNVISWSPFQEDFILSGGDDGSIRVWDLRNTSEPIVLISWHKQPISSVGWHPTDTAMFAVSCLDDSISIWDMSVENAGATTEVQCPDQLMFQHMGQRHISMMQWHPQIPGVIISTAEDGFNVFKTFNV